MYEEGVDILVCVIASKKQAIITVVALVAIIGGHAHQHLPSSRSSRHSQVSPWSPSLVACGKRTERQL